MNKALALIITASVVLVGGLILIAMTSDSLGGFGNQTKKIEENCRFEYKNADRVEELSTRCKAKVREMDSSKANQLLADLTKSEITS